MQSLFAARYSKNLNGAARRMEQAFANRTEAGRLLAEKLGEYVGRDDVIVLGLPRGGVPVACEIAKHLHAPLDVFIVRKLGVPGFEELAAGAIASGGVRVLNQDVMRAIPHADETIELVSARERAELQRREELYRQGRGAPQTSNRTIILVDDGVATGATMRAAVKALRHSGAAKIVVAVPVGPRDTCAEIKELADETICLRTPEFFQAVGQYYEDFSQTTDAEVRELLARAANPGVVEGEQEQAMTEVQIQAGSELLFGNLTIPNNATALVLFAHGSGSSRNSPRNRFVARTLNNAGLATLLFDLLTPEEEAIDLRTREHRFNIGLLAERLVQATRWAKEREQTRHLQIGYFGSSTGGAAALVAATDIPQVIGAVVSRGGRPDLAGDALQKVQAPTLLIVGGNDDIVIELNEVARDRMRCEVKLEIVPGATHLFEEPGALNKVAKLASDWFVNHIGTRSPR
jgi:putative phosphoribosyl transferase